MKKMRTLIEAFTTVALVSLMTACAVAEPDEPESITKNDDVECVDCREAELEHTRDSKDAEQPQKRLRPELEYDLDLMYCEDNYDCQSNICDKELKYCRDYPF